MEYVNGGEVSEAFLYTDYFMVGTVYDFYSQVVENHKWMSES